MNKIGMAAGLALATSGLLSSPVMARSKTAHGKKTKAKAASDVAGDWSGTLNTGVMPLRLVVHFTRQPGGGLAGTVDSLDQGANGIPFRLVRRTGAQVHAEAATIHAVYDGTLDGMGRTITGKWSQGVPLPLTLTRMTAVAKAALGRNDRPQEPKPPYPYTAEDVTFPGGADGVTLAGTLTSPSPSTGGDGPFPAAVLISGSGPNDRDETILRHRLFLVLADSLTRRGIAVLRYDKRGIGKSTGSYAQATSRDFADDAGAAFAYLKTQPRVDARKIGLIGHSEGGLIAPMVAVKSPDVAFLVLLAGTGVPGERILAEQTTLVFKAEGVSDADLAKTAAIGKTLLAVAAHEPDPVVARTKLEALMRQTQAQVPQDMRAAVGETDADIRAKSAAMTSPWMRFLLTYDPAPTLKQVRCPVLALDGSLDLQVPPVENLAAIGAALKAGGNEDVTTTELPGLNHLFQTAHTGSPSEYGRSEETLAPVLLTTVGDWIAAREK